MIKVKSNPFIYLRSLSELNAPNLYLSTKIIMPELLIIDKQMPIRIPNIKPIKPMEQRINPSINPIEKTKFYLCLVRLVFFHLVGVRTLNNRCYSQELLFIHKIINLHFVIKYH